MPAFIKANSQSLSNYAGLYGMEPSNNAAVAPASSHLWGLKDLDFRDLLVGNPLMRWGKVGTPSPKEQIHGLLEVEPLHFTCHAASDGTRIEKIDQGNTTETQLPLIHHVNLFNNF